MATEDDGVAADGGVAKEDIFTTDDSIDQGIDPVKERLGRLLDRYIKTPLLIAWSDWRTRIGGILVIFYLLLGTIPQLVHRLFGIWLIAPTQPNDGPNYLPAFQDMAHPLGTDYIGHDVLALTVHSTPGMLQMALAGVSMAVGWGCLVGFISGYKGGNLDQVLMTFSDIMIVIPGLPLIVVLAAIYSPRNPYVVGAIIAVTMWAPLAREIRSQILTIREEEFVESARAMGLGTPTIIGQEIVPKLAPYVLMRGSIAARDVIFTSVALYFIGILPMSAFDNWGVMMNFAYEQGQAHQLIFQRGHWLLVPMFALMGLAFGLVLLAQGFDRVFNPRLRARHAKTVVDEEELP